MWWNIVNWITRREGVHSRRIRGNSVQIFSEKEGGWRSSSLIVLRWYVRRRQGASIWQDYVHKCKIIKNSAWKNRDVCLSWFGGMTFVPDRQTMENTLPLKRTEKFQLIQNIAPCLITRVNTINRVITPVLWCFFANSKFTWSLGEEVFLLSRGQFAHVFSQLVPCPSEHHEKRSLEMLANSWTAPVIDYISW